MPIGMSGGELYDLAAKISADTSQLEKGMTASQKQVMALAEQLKKVEQTAQGSLGKAGAATKAFSSEFQKLSDNLNVFVSQRIPLVGGAFVRVTENLGKIGETSGEAAGGLAGVLAAMGPVGIAAAGIAVEVGLLAIGLGVVAKVGVTAIETFFGLAESAARFRGEMLDLSQQTGVGVETLSALEIAAKTTGGNIDSIAQSLVIFQSKLDEAQDASSKAGKQFNDLGISTANTEDAFRDALKVLAAMPEGFKQTNDAAELFGRRGGKQVLAILKELHGDLDGAIARFRSMGIIISREDAEAADKFNDQLALLNFQIRALVGKEAIPAATKGLEELSKLLTENRGAVNLLGGAVKVLALGLEGMVLNITRGAEAINLFVQIGARSIPGLEQLAELLERIAKATGIVATQASVGGIVDISRNRGALGVGGGELGGIHQPLSEREIELKKEAERLEKEAEAAAKKRIEFVLNLTEAQRPLKDALRGVNVETHQYAVETSILNGIMKEADRGAQEDARRIARKLDNLESQLKLQKELKTFLEKQNEQTQIAIHGEDGLLTQAAKFITSLETRGAVLQETTKSQIMSNAAVLSGVEALKMYADTLDGLQGPAAALFDLKRPTDEESNKKLAEAIDRALGGAAAPKNIYENIIKAREQIRRLAYDLTNTIDRALQDGFSRGIKAGLVSFAQGILDMIRSAALDALEKRLFEVFSKGLGGGGGGNWLSRLLNIGLNIAAGAAGGGKGGAVAGTGGKFASGLAYVPYDNFPALLHKGERVVPASQNIGGGMSHTFIVNVNVPNIQAAGSGATQHQIAKQLHGMMAKAVLVG